MDEPKGMKCTKCLQLTGLVIKWLKMAEIFTHLVDVSLIQNGQYIYEIQLMGPAIKWLKNG